MRDSVVYELLAEAGLPSLRTAPYEIVLDYGEGPVRLGLYTMVEVVDDTGVPAPLAATTATSMKGRVWGRRWPEQDSHLLEDSFPEEEQREEGRLERHLGALRRPQLREAHQRSCGLAGGAGGGV